VTFASCAEGAALARGVGGNFCGHLARLR